MQEEEEDGLHLVLRLRGGGKKNKRRGRRKNKATTFAAVEKEDTFAAAEKGDIAKHGRDLWRSAFDVINKKKGLFRLSMMNSTAGALSSPAAATNTTAAAAEEQRPTREQLKARLRTVGQTRRRNVIDMHITGVHMSGSRKRTIVRGRPFSWKGYPMTIKEEEFFKRIFDE